LSFEEAVGVLTESPSIDAGSTLDRAARVYNAMQELEAAGFRLLATASFDTGPHKEIPPPMVAGEQKGTRA
jgi:hypothetical protein